MLWEEYYDKLGDWATSTAVSRISKLESFGPSVEIIDAINTIGFDDEKGATRLLKKAIAAGVTFTGDQLSELFLICDEDVINHAIEVSSHHFTAEDLDALYGFHDKEALIDIANRQKIPIPESLADYADTDPEDGEPPIAPVETSAEYDAILQCLQTAHGLLKKAYQYSLIDTNRQKRGATVIKYACIADAQSYISEAIKLWNAPDIPAQVKHPLRGIWPNIRNSTMWQNYLFEGFFTNLMVKREIRKVLKNTETAYHMIQKLSNGG